MEDSLLMIIGVSILVSAIIGVKSGIATALMEIAAGVIIGNVFTGELPEVIHVLSDLGLITLMFMAGLEIDMHFFRSKGKQSIKLGAQAYGLPFIVIMVLVLVIFNLSLYQSLLFAIALSASSVGIVYAIMRKKGILGPRRKLILSGVMVTEFLSMTLLGIFYSEITWVVFVVIAFIFFVRFAYGYIQKNYNVFTDATAENLAIKVILAVLLVAEFLANGSGVDVILIVFVLGMLLASYVDEHETLKKEIEVIGFGFLTPIFFFVTGFGISVSAFGAVFGRVVILVIISFVATYLATYFSARKLFPKRAKIMAVLFNAPMSIGIVAATIGLEKEVLNPEQYVLLLGAVLISSLLAVLFGRYPEDKLIPSLQKTEKVV